MSDNKKYYYMKLKENFFDSDETIILESMTDGYLYSNILMKLYLRSLKDNGRLMFKGVIPYTPEVLGKVLRHNVGVVEKAIQVFKQLGLIEILDNGAIYMLDIQNFIGESSTEADRIRAYRKKVDEQKLLTSGQSVTDVVTNVRTDVQQMNDKSTPEIDIEKELNKKKKKDNTFSAYTSNVDLIEALNSFAEMRKKIKKPLTGRAITIILNKLDELGRDDDEKIELLNQSIEHSWQTVYPLKEGRGSSKVAKNGQATYYQPGEYEAQQAARMAKMRTDEYGVYPPVEFGEPL